jgi:hydrogenase maturation protease
MMPSPHILIGCIGNIFLGDDGFGVAVARRLAERSMPPDVRVIDFGIRGLDLTFALLDDVYDAVILVDAVPRGGPPGTLYVLEPEWDAADAQTPDNSLAMPIETHALDPARVLKTVLALGGRPRRVLLLGCEPTPHDPDADFVMELSAPVQAAVDLAADMIESLVDQVREPRAGRAAVPAGSFSGENLS